MSDIWTPEKRSAVMANIRGVTYPERSLRARLVQNGIKGFKVSEKVGKITPDIIFPTRKIVVFVDGCFWHGCPSCYVRPKTSTKYWKQKLLKNIERDKRQSRELRLNGWCVLRIWECKLEKNPKRQINRILNLIRDKKTRTR